MTAKTYARPKNLSDPDRDFTEEELRDILAKSDGELARYEYMCIFDEFLPAGTYEECAYFIRPLFAYLERLGDRSLEEVDVVDHFLGWMKTNRERLQADGFYLDLMDYFRAWLRRILSSFDVCRNADGLWHLYGGDMAEEIVCDLNRISTGSGDGILREMLVGDDVAPHLYACYLVWCRRHFKVVLDRPSVLLDELMVQFIAGSRSSGIVDASVSQSKDHELEAFWSQCGRD